jgi:hypothetical protein
MTMMPFHSQYLSVYSWVFGGGRAGVGDGPRIFVSEMTFCIWKYPSRPASAFLEAAAIARAFALGHHDLGSQLLHGGLHLLFAGDGHCAASSALAWAMPCRFGLVI